MICQMNHSVFVILLTIHIGGANIMLNKEVCNGKCSSLYYTDSNWLCHQYTQTSESQLTSLYEYNGTLFKCDNGQYIPLDFVNDLILDCEYQGEDESILHSLLTHEKLFLL